MLPAQIVLFDLDGTVSDSAPGILAALRHAFAANGLAPLDPQRELELLGPPFYESLPPLIGSTPLADVIASYRKMYTAGAMFETTVYPGVPEIIVALAGAGARLAVATSKPESYAVAIVEHLGLMEFFETIGGDELDGSLGTKALVIDKVLARIGRPHPSSVLMIGDRAQDVVGARAHAIDTFAAGWGYAPPGELESALPALICPTPADLARALELGEASDPELGESLDPARASTPAGADAEAS